LLQKGLALATTTLTLNSDDIIKAYTTSLPASPTPADITAKQTASFATAKFIQSGIDSFCKKLILIVK